MHAEHAELISALRAENDHLNKQLSRAMEWKAVAEAQEKLMAVGEAAMERAIATIREQSEMLDRYRIELEGRRCP